MKTALLRDLSEAELAEIDLAMAEPALGESIKAAADAGLDPSFAFRIAAMGTQPELYGTDEVDEVRRIVTRLQQKEKELMAAERTRTAVARLDTPAFRKYQQTMIGVVEAQCRAVRPSRRVAPRWTTCWCAGGRGSATDSWPKISMANQLPARVRIVEVGPRDGLQNEPGTIDVATKVGLIERLGDAGLAAIEAASFVSPKWVPQMAGSAEVMRALRRKAGIVYSALTPNMQGFEGALAAGCDEVAVFAAATETFSRRNINCSIAESIERFRPVVEAAREHGLRCRGYISCVLGCPYEGAVDPQAVARLAGTLYDMGCYEISLGDTIGVGTPASTLRAFDACARVVPVDRLAGHFHDTWGMAIANIHAALGLGIGTFDASVGGLGGCPYSPAPRATLQRRTWST